MELANLLACKDHISNNYVECQICQMQSSRQARESNFNDLWSYNTIFMIWLETSIIEKFREHVLFCRSFNGIFMIYSGSPAELALQDGMAGDVFLILAFLTQRSTTGSHSQTVTLTGLPKQDLP